MRGFTDPLVLEANDDLTEGPWLTRDPFVYLLEPYERPVWKVVVERGTSTDLASVPVLRPDRRTRKPAAIHDQLYRQPRLVSVASGSFVMIDRKKADDVFLEAMVVAGVPAWKRQVYYRAVRALGWKRWNQARHIDRVVETIKGAGVVRESVELLERIVADD